MTLYLVDTDVISAGAPAKRRASAAIILWMDRHSDRLFLSVITIAEIAEDIAKAHREGARRKATALAGWLEAVLHLYSSRVLPFDVWLRHELPAGCPIAPAAKARARDFLTWLSPPRRPLTV